MKVYPVMHALQGATLCMVAQMGNFWDIHGDWKYGNDLPDDISM